MTFKKSLKQTIKKLDLFPQQVAFRFNDEPEFKSLTGGCLSLILIAVFVGIFASTLLKTFDKEYIDFTQSLQDQQTPSYFSTSLNQTFMFAIGIDGLDINSGQRYFDIYIQYRHYNSTHKIKQTVPLIPCPKSQWSQLGFGDTFDRLGLQKWLCPSPKTVLELEGKFTSVEFKFYKIAVAKCNPALNPLRPCAADATLEAYLDANQAFSLNFYFINTILNPGSNQYVKKYLQDTNYFPFSKTDGVNANMFISSYNISTDQSLYPMEDMHEQSGGIVTSSAQMVNYQVRSTEYCKVYLRKSPISISIQRSFRGIDDTFSYIGGLFSTILVFLGFMNVYNQLAYEIQISKNCYYYDKNEPFSGDQYNILTFLAYQVYSLFDKVGLELPWPNYKKMHTFLESGKKHLDMRVIMKKILYAQKLGLLLLDQSKRKSLLLQEPLTLEEAEKIRKDLRFYKNYRKKFFPNGKIQQATAQNRLKQLSESNELLNQAIKYPINFRITPIQQDSEIKEQNQFDKSYGVNLIPQTLKEQKSYSIKHEEQFNELQKEMKIYLIQLKTDAVEKNDPIARKILEKVDIRIKKKYLNQNSVSSLDFKPPRKINMGMVLDKIPQ